MTVQPVLDLAFAGYPSGRFPWPLALISSFSKLIRVLVAILSLQFGGGLIARASTITVPDGGDLQAAINSAQSGDTIVLTAGATYAGLVSLPDKAGVDYITIQSSRVSELPDGVRVSPSQSALLAKLVSPGANMAVIATETAAHHYKFIGIEIAPQDASVTMDTLVWLGSPYSDQNTLASVPHDLIFDRCYIHGFPLSPIHRAFAVNSAETSILNSWIDNIQWDVDTQALCGWNGPGPFHIINNHLEASGENVMFGGATVQIPGMIPSDIEIRRNHFFKPLRWKLDDPSYVAPPWRTNTAYSGYGVKNLFELKNAQRVTIDGNLFENCWGDGQDGFAFMLTPRQDPYAVVQYITITNNIFRNSVGGISMMGVDSYTAGSPQQNHVAIVNNLFDKIGGGPLIQLLAVDSVTIDHNTAIHQGNIITFDVGPTTNSAFTNNIVEQNQYGIATSGGGPLSYWFPNGVLKGNLIVGPYYPQDYLPDNFVTPYPANLADVGFVDFANGDYHLALSSPYKGKATDGKDIGCDIDAILAAQSATPGPSPTPTPTPTPIPTPTPMPSPTPSPSPNGGPAVGSRVTLDVDGAFIRSGPSISYGVIGTQGTVSRGTVDQPCVNDPASSGVFCHVVFDAAPNGWVTAEHLIVLAVLQIRLVTLNGDENGSLLAINIGRETAESFVSITTLENFGADKRTRLMIFAVGVSGNAPNTDPSNDISEDGVVIPNLAESVIIEAHTQDGRVYRLPVEFAGAQGSVAGLDQVNVVLIPELEGAGTVNLTLIVNGQRSNAPTIVIS